MKKNNCNRRLLNIFFILFFFCSSTMAQNVAFIGTDNGVNTSTDYPCPIQDFYYATHAQFLYSAGELNIAGISPGSLISEIGWVVDPTVASGHLIEDYSISLLSTNVPSLSLNAWEPGAVQVYGPANYAYPSGYSGNVMFPVSPFYYAGGNLLVEICGGLMSGGYTINPICHLTTGLPFDASHQWDQDVANGCGSVDPTNNATSTNRPVLVINFIPGNLNVPAIEGDIYYDVNQNGAKDTLEIGLANQFLTLNPVGYYGLTDADGHYKFYCDSGNYLVNWNAVSPWTLSSSPATYSISVPPDSAGNDYGIWAPAAAVEYTQLVGYYTGFMRCNTTGYSTISIRNTGLYPANGTTTLIHSSNLPLDTVSSTQGFVITGDTVTWSYSGLLPGQNLSFHGNFYDGAAGDTVTFTYIDSIFDLSWNFQRLYSNSFKFIIPCSADPNDKSVDPVGESAAHYTLMSEDLMYTIRFQNTGNDTAFKVVILDTLDAGLDISTLRILANSHPVSVQMTTGGALRFSFEGILLPDSIVDEAGSHGYVVYSIKPNTGLMDGTIINNPAHIFFDFNADVETNATFNTMVYNIPTSIQQSTANVSAFIYPNPVTGKSRIFLTGLAGEKHLVHIYNAIGERLISETFNGNQYELRYNLPAGIYMFSITDSSGKLIYSSRFIRE